MAKCEELGLKVQCMLSSAEDARFLRAHVTELENSSKTNASNYGLRAELWTWMWSLNRQVTST